MFDIPMKTQEVFSTTSLTSLNHTKSMDSSQSPMLSNQDTQPTNIFSQQPSQSTYPQPQFSYQPSQPTYQQSQPTYSQSQPTYQQPSQPTYQQSQPTYQQSQPTCQQPSQSAYQQSQPTYQQSQQPVYSQSSHPAQTNGVSLKKGQKFALAGNSGGEFKKIAVCLGWDLKNQECDLDSSVFMLDGGNRVLGDNWFVFYGQTSSPDGSIIHSGDSKGQGAGDDEVILIDLTKVNSAVQKITFVVTINEAFERHLNFSMVANAYVRVLDAATNVELTRFLLSDYYSNVTSMVVGELYKYKNQWKFNAVGDGVSKDLRGLCEMYGVNVTD